MHYGALTSAKGPSRTSATSLATASSHGSWMPWRHAPAGVAWFRLDHAVIEGAGSLPLSSVLGPGRTGPTASPGRSRTRVADPNPDRAAVQTAARSVGRRPRRNEVATGGRPGSRQRRVAGCCWRDRPGLDVRDPGAVSQGGSEARTGSKAGAGGTRRGKLNFFVPVLFRSHGFRLT
jgi:hypothetical protein